VSLKFETFVFNEVKYEVKCNFLWRRFHFLNCGVGRYRLARNSIFANSAMASKWRTLYVLCTLIIITENICRRGGTAGVGGLSTRGLSCRVAPQRPE
jgi:hypothetical protein